MIVDRRKDSYDELQILASDLRAKRRRNNLWTTGLIAGAMVAASAYVSTTNQQVDQLEGKKAAAEQQLEELEKAWNDREFQVQQLIRERDGLVAERDFFKDNTKIFADASSNSRLSEAVSKIRTVGGATAAQPQGLALSNLVYLVDGSRLVPMTHGDILWIPEGQFWVQMEVPKDQTKPPTIARLYRASRPEPGVTGTGEIILDESKRVAEIPSGRGDATAGNVNCIRLELSDRTLRPGFGGRYVDMDIQFLNKRTCGSVNSN